MNRTGLIESWSRNPGELGPIYPFVGSEVWMFFACVIFCVAFFVWKFYGEQREYNSNSSVGN